MEYNNSFFNRVKQYNYAIQKYPNVLKNEFITAINICNIKSTDVVLNILAGGNPLNKYFKYQPSIYKEYEINGIFCTLGNIKLCQLDKIPEDDNTADIIITLTSLHHINEDERTLYYKECFRILKDNIGKFVIGDILKDSKEARWLNEFVNKYNSRGHNGIFFSKNDKQIIEKNGFITKIEIRTYPWIFDNYDELLDFFKNLFGLDLATDEEILCGIEEYLCIEQSENKIIIKWSLIYFISTKDPDFLQHQ